MLFAEYCANPLTGLRKAYSLLRIEVAYSAGRKNPMNRIELSAHCQEIVHALLRQVAAPSIDQISRLIQEVGCTEEGYFCPFNGNVGHQLGGHPGRTV